jgi:hypothetical protein
VRQKLTDGEGKPVNRDPVMERLGEIINQVGGREGGREGREGKKERGFNKNMVRKWYVGEFSIFSRPISVFFGRSHRR